jgi:hypothetical protein
MKFANSYNSYKSEWRGIRFNPYTVRGSRTPIILSRKLGFILGRVLINAPCPLYPRKRTWFRTIVMSALCQKQKSTVPWLETSPRREKQREPQGVQSLVSRALAVANVLLDLTEVVARRGLQRREGPVGLQVLQRQLLTHR